MAYVFKKPLAASKAEAAKRSFEAKATFTDKENLGPGEVHVHLSGTGSSFEGKALANRLSQRRSWPLHRSSGYAAMTYHRFPGNEADKCLLLDLATFSQLFENPKPFLRELKKQALELCAEWNTSYGGGKRVGERKHPEKVFTIEEVTIPLANKEYRSAMRLAISTWSATRELQMSHAAKMTPEKIKVSIKHATSLPPRYAQADWDQEEMRLSSFGLYLPLHSFEKMCTSKEMAGLVKAAKQHLEHQLPKGKGGPKPLPNTEKEDDETASNGDEEEPAEKRARQSP